VQPPASDSIDAQLERARGLYAAGDKVAASAVYDAILAEHPNDPRTLCLRGLVQRDLGNILSAEKDFRRAIKSAPDLPLSYQLLGDLLHNAKHLVMAADVYQQGLQRDPHNLPIMANLAHTRLGLGQYEAALDLSRRVVAADAGQQESWFRIGVCLCQQRHFDDALAPLTEALRLKPDCLRSRAALYAALHRLGRDAEARAECASAQTYIGGELSHLTQFNEILVWLDCPELAFPTLEQHVRQHPGDVAALNLLARLQIVAGDERAGTALLAKAVELAPRDADLQLTLGLQLFKFGAYREGLEHYRHRWDRNAAEAYEGKWDVPAPAWNGEALGEGTLMVWTEQGIGDLAMFAGFFNDLADLAPRVMLETIGRFRGLMQRSFPWAHIYQRDQLPPDYVSRFDIRAQAPIGDLPLLLEADFDHLPARQGYLIPSAVETWRLRERYLAKFPGRLIVGISWRSGNKSSATTRSAELDLWQDLLRDPACGFVSLQYGEVGAEIAAANARLRADIYHDPEVDPLLDLDLFAAQVAAVDLVISVDNSTVHFAGALGKPVWALLPFVADWRWLKDRSDSIWYAAARLFRQPSAGDWPSVMARVQASLGEFTPDLAEAHLVALMRRCAAQLANLGRSADAEVFLRRLLRIDVDDVDALHGLGRIGLATGHNAEATPFLARAAFLAPARPDIQYDLARTAARSPDREIALPAWDGIAVSGQRLLLRSSGVLADDIAATLNLGALRGAVDHLAVTCHPALMPLLARQFRRISVFGPDELGADDVAGMQLTAQAPLVRIRKVPSEPMPAWLLAEEGRIADHRRNLRALFGDRLIVGLVAQQEGAWAGITGADWHGLDPDVIAILASLEGIGFVALDEAVSSWWPDVLRGRLHVDPRIDLRRQPEHYAAALCAVDVVIAVESAAAWLAAALGRPLFLCEGRTTPAQRIPATRYVRQSANGSWARALAELMQTLAAVRN
jgi:tetratricopeptide (TPR) repeat protein